MGSVEADCGTRIPSPGSLNGANFQMGLLMALLSHLVFIGLQGGPLPNPRYSTVQYRGPGLSLMGLGAFKLIVV